MITQLLKSKKDHRPVEAKLARNYSDSPSERVMSPLPGFDNFCEKVCEMGGFLAVCWHGGEYDDWKIHYRLACWEVCNFILFLYFQRWGKGEKKIN